MGYFGTCYTDKKDLIDELNSVDGWKGVTKVESSLRGNELYQLIHCEDGRKWIRINILSCYNGNWGYKPFSESSHPYWFNCPQKFLKQSTEMDAGAVEWRKACFDNHKEKKDSAARVNSFRYGQKVYRLQYDCITSSNDAISEVYFNRKHNGTIAYFESAEARNSLFQDKSSRYYATKEEALKVVAEKLESIAIEHSESEVRARKNQKEADKLFAKA